MPIRNSAEKSSVSNLGAGSAPKRTIAQTTAAKDTGSNFSNLLGTSKSYANNPVQSDGDKYQVAVAQARTELGDGASDKDLRLRTDDIYTNDLGGQISAADLRGETQVTQLIRGADEGLTDAFNTAGSGLDWLYDKTIGGLTGTQDAFDGEDIGGALDIGTDIGLGALSLVPGANAAAIPLMLAKQGIQESDNIYEAATGRDAVSLQKLTDGQRLSKGFGSALNIGLGSVPVIGKMTKPLVSALKGGAKETAEAATKAAADMASSGPVKSFLKNRGRDLVNTVGYTGTALGAGALNRAGETGESWDEALLGVVQDAKENPASVVLSLLGPAAGSRILRKLPSVTGKQLNADRDVLTSLGKKAAKDSKVSRYDAVTPGDKQNEALNKLLSAANKSGAPSGRSVQLVPRQTPFGNITIPTPGIVRSGQRPIGRDQILRTKKNAPALESRGIRSPQMRKTQNSNMKLLGAGAFGQYENAQAESDDNATIRMTPEEILSKLQTIRK